MLLLPEIPSSNPSIPLSLRVTPPSTPLRLRGVGKEPIRLNLQRYLSDPFLREKAKSLGPKSNEQPFITRGERDDKNRP